MAIFDSSKKLRHFFERLFEGPKNWIYFVERFLSGYSFLSAFFSTQGTSEPLRARVVTYVTLLNYLPVVCYSSYVCWHVLVSRCHWCALCRLCDTVFQCCTLCRLCDTPCSTSVPYVGCVILVLCVPICGNVCPVTARELLRQSNTGKVCLCTCLLLIPTASLLGHFVCAQIDLWSEKMYKVYY